MKDNSQRENSIDIKSIRRMLREMGDLAEQSSLTGSLGSGAARLGERFNRLLETLIERGDVPAGLFAPVPTDGADYGPIGVESRMLAAYLRDRGREESEDDPQDDFSQVVSLAPFVDSSDLAAMIREMMASGTRPPKHLLTAIAPFLHRSDLGEFLRASARRVTPEPPRQPSSEAPAAPAAPATPAAPAAPYVDQDFSLARASQELAEMHHRDRMLQLVTEIQNPHLSDEERGAIARRIAELSAE